MADVQERVAQLEGRVEGYVLMLADVVGALRHLEARMDQRFIGVDLLFTSLEGRLTALDQKVGDLDRKLETGFLSWVSSSPRSSRSGPHLSHAELRRRRRPSGPDANC